jgi:hypothetical protein
VLSVINNRSRLIEGLYFGDSRSGSQGFAYPASVV